MPLLSASALGEAYLAATARLHEPSTLIWPWHVGVPVRLRDNWVAR